VSALRVAGYGTIEFKAESSRLNVWGIFLI
jgi:hypothetical protein